MKLHLLKRTLMLSLVAATVSIQTSNAQVLMSAGTYTQNFDSLATTNASTTWVDNSNLPNWYTSRASGGPSFTNYLTGTGSGNAGAIYSFGVSSNSTQRALGLLVSGSTGVGAFGVRMSNDTVNAQANITVSFTGEEWRNANAAAIKLAFSYQIGSLLTNADSTNSQSWTSFTNLDFTTPAFGGTIPATLDGTVASNQVVFSNVVLPGARLEPGQEIFLRWLLVRPTSGSSHGVGIDNLTVSFTATNPAPVAPSIITQPASKTVFLGDLASFSVTASGTAPFTYQWYFPNLSSPLSGATNQTLTLTNAHLTDVGTYFVNVANGVGNTNSAAATLTVNTRTPIVTNIAYLRTLINSNYVASDTTNLYTVTGTVTTAVDMTSAANDEFFMQDSTAGIAVFIANGASIRPNAGDIVQVTGPLGNFNGLMEFNMNANNPAHVYSVTGSTNLPAPIPFDLATVTNIPVMKALEGSRVVVTNVYLAQGTNILLGFPSGGSVNMTNLSGKVLPLFVNASEFDVIGFGIPEVAASVIGVLGQFTSTLPATNGFELDLTDTTGHADLVVGTPLVPLTLTTSGGNVVVSWSSVPNGFNLEYNTDLSTTNWLPVTQTTNVVSSQKTVTFVAPTDTEFLRLHAVR
ncbi:MAG: endonuclease [Pedosphaera sp.]|nr:endonuclease [Pedosphaera sp.]